MSLLIKTFLDLKLGAQVAKMAPILYELPSLLPSLPPSLLLRAIQAWNASTF